MKGPSNFQYTCSIIIVVAVVFDGVFLLLFFFILFDSIQLYSCVSDLKQQSMYYIPYNQSITMVFAVWYKRNVYCVLKSI